ncbi:Peroxidase 1 [Triticum urartu]|uniref:Peroxidase n=1 Tax=Triticum urartu TaxID=4572 RepID=M7ZWQ4_TRIUA|nr:Peroxidase 1 [Triticum urartu]
MGSFLIPISLLVLAASSAVAQLEMGYYRKSCPDVEAIVREEMVKIISAAPSLAGPLLRLHFHDCFVRGCDASVLLDSTKGNLAERDAKPNKSLRGFGSVERVKAKLEAACPGVVSCADVLTLMARDAVVLAKGPSWPVALGRRDGSVSTATEASDELPPSFGDVPLLTRIFASKGLDLKDLVVLSGAHTLGTAHCPSFADRLYNTTGNGLVDPSLDSEGLFRSDAALLTDATTEEYVRHVATGKFDDAFFRDFSESMIKMGNIGVLTGRDGDIRKKCYVLN